MHIFGPFDFERRLGNWVAEQVGCLPAIKMVEDTTFNGNPLMIIECTDALMKKIEKEFAGDINNVRKLVTLSDIPPSERNCWKPRP
jgi:hypothetical protein